MRVFGGKKNGKAPTHTSAICFPIVCEGVGGGGGEGGGGEGGGGGWCETRRGPRLVRAGRCCGEAVTEWRGGSARM